MNKRRPVDLTLPFDIEARRYGTIRLYSPIPPPKPKTVRTFRAEMFRLHNLVRRQAKLSPFRYDLTLQTLAQRQSGFMSSSDLLEHTIELGEAVTKAQYTWGLLGENVAYHSWTGNVIQTARAIFRGWMASPGHRANILNPEFEDIGIGFWVSDTGLGFSAAIFGTPR